MPPLLSAILIVKNEEKNLPRCLESLRSVCDEICVMDTGSTDRTVEIATSFGAKIGNMEWTGNESDARNASAQMATGKWIFVVDADEAISPELASELKEYLSKIDSQDYQSASVVWRNHYSDQSTSLTRITRIGRNHPNFHFEGRIHPTATYENPTFEFSGFLEHYGYQWTPEQKLKKSAHMLEHLRPYITGDKPDLSRLSQYITYLLVSSKTAEFNSWLEKIFQIYSSEERLSEPYWRQAVPNILLFLADQDDFATGENMAHEILARYPDSVSPLFYLLQGSVKKQAWDSAKKLASGILPLLDRPVETLNVVYPEVQRPLTSAWEWLSECYRSTQSKQEIPETLPHYRNLHVILFAAMHFQVTSKNPRLHSLLKIFTALRTSRELSGWSIASIEKNLRTSLTESQPPSVEDLLSRILFIEFYSITGNMSLGVPMVKETLEAYSHVRWLALLMDRSGADWRLSGHISEISHLA